MGIATAPTDYVDFYSSLQHALNLGRIFRPDSDPLLPNWRYIPVGYHGRTGTLVADDASIPRPTGYRLTDGVPTVGPCGALDTCCAPGREHPPPPVPRDNPRRAIRS